MLENDAIKIINSPEVQKKNPTRTNPQKPAVLKKPLDVFSKNLPVQKASHQHSAALSGLLRCSGTDSQQAEPLG